MGRWSGRKVAVLYGGRSAEREVSLATGKACADALRTRGLDVTLVDAGLDLAERLRAMGAEVAFLALHGRFGEDGCAQGLLESMGIPYTGSGVLASAMGMDKVISKLVFRDAGLSLAAYRVFPAAQAAGVTVADLPFGLPAVVKPACEGSSVGVHVVKEPGQLAPALADAATFKGDVIVEEYVRGQEVNVAVLDGEALGTVEMVPSREFYDYVAKYTPGSTTYHVPARLAPEATARVSRDAETAYRALRCAGAARVDFIVAPDGTPRILEVNTLPGMTGTSLVPKIAAGRGIPFPELCERLLDGASLKA
jgi:D-alanine-D-alanine ligase